MNTLRRFVIAGFVFTMLLSPASAAESWVDVTVKGHSGAVPQGAQRVPLVTMDIRNACATETSISSVTLRHRGLGNPEDFDRIYLFADGRRLSRGVGSFVDARITIRPRQLRLARCERRSIDVLGDFGTDAAAQGEHAFEVESIELTDGAQARIKSATRVAPTTAKAGPGEGTVRVELLPLLRNLTYGANRVVSRLQLRGDRRLDQLVRSITFTNDGSARGGDLRNLRLERSNGQRLSGKLATMDGERVTFALNPALPLRSNETILLHLKADVRASGRRTVRFLIEEPSDIEAIRDRRR